MSNGCRFNDAETVSAGCQNNSVQQRDIRTSAKGACRLLLCFAVQRSRVKSTDAVRAPAVGEQIR